jgi:hypothetical protein
MDRTHPRVSRNESAGPEARTIAFVTGVLFGVFAQVSLPVAIAAIPEFLWELSLGIYLVVKGFQPAPIIEAYDQDAGHAAGAV